MGIKVNEINSKDKIECSSKRREKIWIKQSQLLSTVEHRRILQRNYLNYDKTVSLRKQNTLKKYALYRT